MIGLGNLESAPDTTGATLEAALKDQSGVVRVAAARALFQLQQHEEPALAKASAVDFLFSSAMTARHFSNSATCPPL